MQKVGCVSALHALPEGVGFLGQVPDIAHNTEELTFSASEGHIASSCVFVASYAGPVAVGLMVQRV